MGQLVYLDETKAKSYVMAAVSLEGRHVGRVRHELRSLILSGQASLHMRSEKERRRRQILDAVLRLVRECDMDTVIYDAGVGDSEIARRNRCLREVVADIPVDKQVTLVFDRDETLIKSDRQMLIEALRERNLGDLIHYEHAGRHQDALLALPDVFAWCWNRGGWWRQEIRRNLSGVRVLDP